MAGSATGQGALSIAITNAPASPLAKASRHTIPLLAGPELSVVATKTYVASLVAGLALIAHWKQDAVLLCAIDDLLDQLAREVAFDWSGLCADLNRGNGLFVLGRGASAVSNEAALKFLKRSARFTPKAILQPRFCTARCRWSKRDFLCSPSFPGMRPNPRLSRFVIVLPN